MTAWENRAVITLPDWRQMNQNEATEQEIAIARHNLAMTILQSENAGDILQAMNALTVRHAKRAMQTKKSAKGKKKKTQKAEAKEWKRVADELYTVVMCAVYTKQDQASD